jgi:hypothetical protein
MYWATPPKHIIYGKRLQSRGELASRTETPMVILQIGINIMRTRLRGDYEKNHSAFLQVGLDCKSLALIRSEIVLYTGMSGTSQLVTRSRCCVYMLIGGPP